MTEPTYSIRVGGLMRCCLLTIEEDSPPTPLEHQHLRCLCGTKLIFLDGAWQWEDAPSKSQTKRVTAMKQAREKKEA